MCSKTHLILEILAASTAYSKLYILVGGTSIYNLYAIKYFFSVKTMGYLC
jgi:hypothetical protein